MISCALSIGNSVCIALRRALVADTQAEMCESKENDSSIKGKTSNSLIKAIKSLFGI